MSLNNNKAAITRSLVRLAGISLGVLVCLAVSTQGQPATDTSSDNFQAEMRKPATLINSTVTDGSQADEQKAVLSLTEEFSHDRSLALWKESPQIEKPSSLPLVRAGYGQFFSAHNLVPHVISNGSETPSCLYLKASFSF